MLTYLLGNSQARSSDSLAHNTDWRDQARTGAGDETGCISASLSWALIQTLIAIAWSQGDGWVGRGNDVGLCGDPLPKVSLDT